MIKDMGGPKTCGSGGSESGFGSGTLVYRLCGNETNSEKLHVIERFLSKPLFTVRAQFSGFSLAPLGTQADASSAKY